MVVEIFRAEPMWLRAKAPSPRQRRWFGYGLGLVMTCQLVSLSLEGDTPLWVMAFALFGLDIVAILIGLVWGPTEPERDHRERMLSQQRD